MELTRCNETAVVDVDEEETPVGGNCERVTRVTEGGRLAGDAEVVREREVDRPRSRSRCCDD